MTILDLLRKKPREIKYPPIKFKFERVNKKKIGVKFYDLMWKLKYGTPEFEYPPRLEISLWKWKLVISLSWGDDLADTIYYESLLDIAYWGFTLEQAYRFNQWGEIGKDLITLKTLGMWKK